MKKEMNEKKGYVAPQMEIVNMQALPMLNSASAVSGAGEASDIGYDGLGSDGEFGD